MPTKRLEDEAVNNLVLVLLNAWNAHDIERAVNCYAEDYSGVDVGDAKPHYGLKGAREYITRYLQAFPDLNIATETLIIQDDQLAVSWTAAGTHQGRLMNIPPTDRSVKVRGVSLLTIKDGRVRQGFYMWDLAGLLRNIGLLPEL